MRKGIAMIRIWFYDKLIKYYKYCRDRWNEVYRETKGEEAKHWARYYSDKYLFTIKKRSAYKYYISLKM